MESLADLDDETLFTHLAKYRADLAAEKAQIENDEQHDGNSEYADNLAAIEIYLEELEIQRTVARDARLAESIVEAKLTDLSTVSEITQQEQQAREDHTYARRLAEGEDDAVAPTNDNNDDNTAPSYEEEIANATTPALSKLAGLWVSAKAGRALHPENKEFDPDPEPEFEGLLRAQCCLCLDHKSYFETVAVPCGDTWCQDCLRELFYDACRDESLYPPRCCTEPIPVASVEVLLPRDMIVEVEQKRVELSTQDRTYCANTACSKFIPPADITSDIAECQKCNSRTCIHCKKEAHENECQEDADAQAVLELAEQEGWKRCGNCQAIVELKHGCNHISCRCSHEFCYKCGVAPWKNCGCPQWDEEMLIERTQQVAAREGRDVAEVREEIITRHNCNHVDHWEYVGGGGRCEECSQRLPIFLFRCDRCHLEVCRRCRFTRIR
ncbi:hypothetical protein OHC33_003519 [Knufia fluminis]|uniref:RBR-type E3 ubiquitin transferase n=1 Tax=Knufia fluminis TaxID=191047 RepID=A0AAN8EHT7_9EURO|nr:hypothetical protein OHC33_003519 [Knufia fluminis]